MGTSLPASSTQYLAYVSQNLAKHSVIPSAYAAGEGFGFKSLGPVLVLWKMFRDIVYLLFVVAFVVYGFMIMFRAKISSQTLVSIQTAIPNLIVVLLMVTFSYAIAGLIIDLTYVFQEVLLNTIFLSLKPATIDVEPNFLGITLSGITGWNFLKMSVSPDEIAKLVGGKDHFTASVLIGSQGGIFIPMLYVLTAITVGDTISKIANIMTPQWGIPWLDTIIKEFGSNPVINLILWLVLFIAILYTFFKVTYMLIQAFVMVIFNVIFSPFILLKGVMPGTDAFGEWIRTLISNMAAFPATIFCFLLSFIFMGKVIVDPAGIFKAALPILRMIPNQRFEYNYFSLVGGEATGALTVPPPLGFIWGTSGEAMTAIIGIGILLMTPKIVEMLQEALKAPAFKYGAAIGEALNYGFGPVSAPINFAKDRAMDYAKTKTNEYVGGRVQEVQNTLGRRPEPLDPRVLARMNYGTGSANPDDSLDNTEPG
jgi:hypothetical protein